MPLTPLNGRRRVVLLNDVEYTWRDRDYVALRPGIQPAHIFRVSRIQ
jgi:hypothetical protein